MKILRSVSRRGFSVGTAGWFTVLKPNTWFPASRLQKASSNFGTQKERLSRSASGESGVRGPVNSGPWTVTVRSAEELNRIRLATAVVGAIAITSAMLWWIMHP